MTPQSFDPITCRHLIGDARARILEAQARELADNNQPLGRGPDLSTSYWGAVQEEAEWRVMCEAYGKRMARIERKNKAAIDQQVTGSNQ